MLQKIRQLERESARLEPSVKHRGEIADLAIGYAEEFLNGLPEVNTFVTDEGRSMVLEQAFAEDAGELPGLLETLKAVD